MGHQEGSEGEDPFVAQANDYMNVILHALENVPPLRDYFLRDSNYSHIVPPPGDQTFILGWCDNMLCACLSIISSAFSSKVRGIVPETLEPTEF